MRHRECLLYSSPSLDITCRLQLPQAVPSSLGSLLNLDPAHVYKSSLRPPPHVSIKCNTFTRFSSDRRGLFPLPPYCLIISSKAFHQTSTRCNSPSLSPSPSASVLPLLPLKQDHVPATLITVLVLLLALVVD